MDKFDRNIIELLANGNKIDNGSASVLCQNERVDALVRVRNPFHFGVLENKFEITHTYPFIRTVGIKCGLKEAVSLCRMQEVEYVSAQSKVLTLDDENMGQSCDFEHNDKAHECEQPFDQRKVCRQIKNGIPAMSQTDENFGSEKSKGKNEGYDNLQSLNAQVKTLSAQGLDGSGVGLCVLDTGVAPHADLSIPKERIIHFEDFINGEKEPYDDNGHGTFVAGVACGNGLTSAGEIAGVARGADIVGLKVICDNGESGTFKILDGMQWLFDNYRRYGIRVACMSFGAEPLKYADPLKMGVEMLVRSGICVVVAVGNSGENALKSPAISGEVIAVGAVDSNDNVASFSSRGVYQGIARPDVYADGVDVKGIRVGGTYVGMTGTSASAPYIAGACCLLCQKYRNIKPYQIKNIILNNSLRKNGVMIFH